MRFYFEDHAAGNVSTKCLRVCSNSSTHEVIDTLSEKFRPDMKMLTTCYSLYEVHTDEGKYKTQLTLNRVYRYWFKLPLWGFSFALGCSEFNIAVQFFFFCGSRMFLNWFTYVSNTYLPISCCLIPTFLFLDMLRDKERKLDLNEKPLVVQLKWNSDNREGRFVLKSDIIQVPINSSYNEYI